MTACFDLRSIILQHNISRCRLARTISDLFSALYDQISLVLFYGVFYDVFKK